MPFNNNYRIGVVNNPLTESVFIAPIHEGGSSPPPPPPDKFWISNVGNQMISSTGRPMVFGGVVPPPGDENWITNNFEDMVDSTGDFLIFED